MEDGITASLYTYLTDLTVFAKSEGIPMGTHSLHKIERQHIKMPPLGAKVPDPYAPFTYRLIGRVVILIGETDDRLGIPESVITYYREERGPA
jgi:hypothetical protein